MTDSKPSLALRVHNMRDKQTSEDAIPFVQIVRDFKILIAMLKDSRVFIEVKVTAASSASFS